MQIFHLFTFTVLNIECMCSQSPLAGSVSVLHGTVLRQMAIEYKNVLFFKFFPPPTHIYTTINTQHTCGCVLVSHQKLHLQSVMASVLP